MDLQVRELRLAVGCYKCGRGVGGADRGMTTNIRVSDDGAARDQVGS